MKHLKWSLPSLALLSAALLQPAWSQPQDYVLWVFHSQSAEPVARFNPQTQRFTEAFTSDAPPESPQSQAQYQQFMQQYLPLQQANPVYQNGEVQGSFIATKQQNEYGCFDYPPMLGILQQTTPITEEYPAFLGFSSGFPGVRTYAAKTRPAAFLQPATAHQLAHTFLQSQGHTPAWGNLKLDQQKPFAISTDHGLETQLFVSGHVSDPQSEPGTCPAVKFWAIGQWQQGQLKVVTGELTDRHSELETCGSYQLISSFATDPQANKVLIADSGYEWWSYLIYGYQQGTYQKLFAGGGGGC